jgi:hypothetical protein
MRILPLRPQSQRGYYEAALRRAGPGGIVVDCFVIRRSALFCYCAAFVVQRSRASTTKRYRDSNAGSMLMLVFCDDEGSCRAGPMLPIWVCEAA